MAAAVFKAFVLFILLSGAPVLRAEVSLETLHQIVQAQGKQIARLQHELNATRAELGEAKETLKGTKAELSSTVAYLEEQTDTGSGSSWRDRTSVGGYGEVHYSNVEADDASRDFKETDIHRYVLFVNHEFNERVRFFSEFEIEHGLVKDTASGSNGGEVEIEQAYVELDLNENHQAKAGVFLIPVGILNETHEPPTFYGVERNSVENIILPATWWENGLALSGQYGNGLSWDFAVHNGLEVPITGSSAMRIRSGRQKSSKARAEDLAYTARLSYSGVPGLQLSASYQHQTDLSQMSGDGVEDANLLAAHAIFNRGGFQLRALWAEWDIDGALAAFTGADKQSGWYVEPSYRLRTPGFKLLESLGIYTRYEHVEGIRSQDQFEQWEVGLNLWPTDNVVFKIDYRDREHDLSAARGRDFKSIDLGIGFQF